MNYKSYSDLSIDILQELHKVPESVQMIVGIPRSGMVPAYILGAQLNLPVLSLAEFLQGVDVMVGERQMNVDLQNIDHVLIFDDSVHSGTAIKKVKDKLSAVNFKINYTYAAVYSSKKDVLNVDFYFKYLPQPRVFQWNYKNHFITTKSCYDIDGVLCVDPTDDENDDGPMYRQFILNAKPLFIPTYHIPCLITSRLEKYRNETVTWLKKHHVDYGDLIMLDIDSAEERRALGIHAKFKAEVYAGRDEDYFIESNWNQAKLIFEMSKKPVFCTQK